MYDLLIRNCRVLDGTGSPPICSDVAVHGGRIAAVGRALGPARECFDAGGLTLAPGFIDSHSHNDLILDGDPAFAGALEQGITSIIAGQCGESAAPLSPERLADTMRVCGAEGCADPAARYDFGTWLRALPPMGVNAAFFVGHGNLRAAAMGFDDREPTAGELAHMERLLDACMRGGALGVSFGLIYPPGVFSKTDELCAMARVAARYGGLCAVHLRSENRALIPAVEEMLLLARQTGCRTVISHHKATGGPPCWGQTARTLELMDEANAEGFDVYCDQYPYTASATGLSTLLPDHVHALPQSELIAMLGEREGRARLREQVLGGQSAHERLQYTMIGGSDSRPALCGQMLNAAADAEGLDPCELLFDLLRDDRLHTGAIFHTMSEEDVARVMRWPRTMVGTDGVTPSLREGPGGHPRAWATFPRVLGRYVRERGILSLPEAVRRMTSLPAQVYSLGRKGLIREGMDADLVLFDPARIGDRADYADPTAPSEGLQRVWLGGQTVVADGRATGARCGRALPRQGTEGAR